MRDHKYNYNSQTGMYRNKILIQKQTIEIDARKQQTASFVDCGYYFAMLKTQKADEIVSADNEKTLIIDRFIVKYSKKLDQLINDQGTAIRIIYNSRVYDVTTAINDNGLNETITFLGRSEVLTNANNARRV